MLFLKSMRPCYSYEDLIRTIIVTFVQHSRLYKRAFTNISFERHGDRWRRPHGWQIRWLIWVPKLSHGAGLCRALGRRGGVGASEGWAVAHLAPLPDGPKYLITPVWTKPVLAPRVASVSLAFPEHCRITKLRSCKDILNLWVQCPSQWADGPGWRGGSD